MLGRLVASISIAMLAAIPAHADPAEFCAGRYAETAKVVDTAYARYGTLYSGGNHWQVLDNVGPTLDVYRLLRGYPDIQLRTKVEPIDRWRGTDEERAKYKDLFNWPDNPQPLWDHVRWAVTRNAPAKPTNEQIFWAGYGWDMLTAGDRTNPDWWRTVASTPDLPPARAFLVAKARTEPALEWMQMVLAASNAPWANNWLAYDNVETRTLAGYQSIATAALTRYERGDGIEWLVAAALNAPNIASVPRLRPALRKVADTVASCDATQAQYAALAASRLSIERSDRTLVSDPASFDDMPPGIRSDAILRTINVAMAMAPGNPNEARSIANALARVGADTQGLTLLKLYLARSIDEVPVLDASKLLRAYNLLSADSLTALARRDPKLKPVVNAAFARHVALGNTARAASLIADLKTANPTQANIIDRIWAGRQSEERRLALLVLAVPKVAALVHFGDVWDGDVALALNAEYYAGHKNLPSQYKSTAFFQRDFEVELRPFQHLGAYHGMRGYTVAWMERLHSRRTAYNQTWTHEVPALIPINQNQPGAPFGALIAQDELERLTGREQLMITVANRIVSWAEAAGSGSADRELIAGALADVIVACKHNTCGVTRGQPTAKHAFKLLKGKFVATKGAKKVRWWFETEADFD